MKLVEISERVSSQALLSLSLSMYIYIILLWLPWESLSSLTVRLHLSRWSNWRPLQAQKSHVVSKISVVKIAIFTYLSQEFKGHSGSAFVSMSLSLFAIQISQMSQNIPEQQVKNNKLIQVSSSLDLQSTNALEMKRNASRIWSLG